ncbi:Glucooligosaccharide oxidase [Mycena indigotica]|uniref:Glucooligosaccharide oxidase n=1 Tax=Mycena indigotica TaxID=2126181 RepID=A0A8H6SE64_9AGAR|nr:Glucooligosaccharide oxidase [Mycena indigotica]KAF7297120.1 Glucooligosaccharide oxidase [Mycena indigotica]
MSARERRNGHAKLASDSVDTGVQLSEAAPALLDLSTILSMVLGGCCVNVWAYEQLLNMNARIGSALTFSQVVFITLQTLPRFLVFHPTYRWFPSGLKPRQVPIYRWAVQVVLLTTSVLLNNWAFAYKVPLTILIVFRSAGLPVSMLFGFIAGKRYSPTQVLSVLLVTTGVILVTLARPSAKSASSITEDLQQYTVGISMLTASIVLTGVVGLLQEWTYTTYGPCWQEGVFYTHFLSLPVFVFLVGDVEQGLRSLSDDTGRDTSALGSWLILGLNLFSQLICVSGVNRLSSEVSSVSTNIVLTTRKAISLLFSVWWFGNEWNEKLAAGASMVFFGSLLFTAGGSKRKKRLDSFTWIAWKTSDFDNSQHPRLAASCSAPSPHHELKDETRELLFHSAMTSQKNRWPWQVLINDEIFCCFFFFSRMCWRTLLGALILCVSTTLADSSSLQSQLSLPGVTSFFPGDPGYANASRPFNLRFTLEPIAVVYPASVKEVSEIVKIGKEHNLRVSARSGGHSYIANGLGGRNGALVIDMSNFKKISVNSAAKTAVIETGNRLGDIALALNNHGLAMPHGTCPYVGIGGHSSYGGFGFSSNMWGLTLDNILSINLVLANGTITQASPRLNADLFWAMRGAGPSFAIATSIEFKLFTPPAAVTIFNYNWQLTATQAANALGAFQTFIAKHDPPAEFGSEIVLTRGHVEGNVTFALAGAWHAAPELLNATVQPFLDRMPPLNDVSFSQGNWLAALENLGGGNLNTSVAPDGTDTFFAKSLMTPEASPMNAAALEAFMETVATEGFTTNVSWFFQIELFGGANSAINAVPLDATAFAHRSSLFTIQFYASSIGNVLLFPDFGFTFLDHVVNNITTHSPPNWDFGAYTNYMEDQLPDFKRQYYGSHYPRLFALKKKLDPTGVFDFPVGVDD